MATETGDNGAAALGTSDAAETGAKPQTMQYPLSIIPPHPDWMHIVVDDTALRVRRHATPVSTVCYDELPTGVHICLLFLLSPPSS